MGRKGYRKPGRVIMRGQNNRWGRFQCPSDGSICKSIEAWHWHRVKYHPKENINFVELSTVEDNMEDERQECLASAGRTPGPQSVSVTTHRSLTAPTSSSRLLPPEAFAPLRREETNPDNMSDLTEPDIPVLLSEEITCTAASVHKAVEDSREETTKQDENCSSAEYDSIRVCNTQESQCNYQLKDTSRESSFRERFAYCRDQGSLCTDDNGVSKRNDGHILSLNPSLQHPTFRLISAFVIELVGERKQVLIEDILPQAEAQFSDVGISRELLTAVVTGTLIGAVNQWQRGYDVGWRDGAREVLNAPFTRGLSCSRHSLNETTSPLMTSKGNTFAAEDCESFQSTLEADPSFIGDRMRTTTAHQARKA